MTEKPRRLGRGLEALLGAQPASERSPTAATNPGSDAPHEIPIAAIVPNRLQPRRSFNPAELAELESSLKANGLLQPVAVRPQGDGTYELIAGERRLRAATRLGWTQIPALVRPLEDRDMLVLALVENLQRADLNALDEALGYQRLMQEFSLTQQQVADAVGKDRSTIANLLRVLTLPEGIRKLIRDDAISLGHARALLGMPDERAMLDAARQVIEQQLSVRDVERMAQRQRPSPARPSSTPKAGTAGSAKSHASNAEVRRLTELLRRRLQTDVRIDLLGDSKGAMVVSFYSSEDLLRITEVVLGRPADQL